MTHGDGIRHLSFVTSPISRLLVLAASKPSPYPTAAPTAMSFSHEPARSPNRRRPASPAPLYIDSFPCPGSMRSMRKAGAIEIWMKMRRQEDGLGGLGEGGKDEVIMARVCTEELNRTSE